jgi:hypothetical protein
LLVLSDSPQQIANQNDAHFEPRSLRTMTELKHCHFHDRMMTHNSDGCPFSHFSCMQDLGCAASPRTTCGMAAGVSWMAQSKKSRGSTSRWKYWTLVSPGRPSHDIKLTKVAGGTAFWRGGIVTECRTSWTLCFPNLLTHTDDVPSAIVSIVLTVLLSRRSIVRPDWSSVIVSHLYCFCPLLFSISCLLSLLVG